MYINKIGCYSTVIEYCNNTLISLLFSYKLPFGVTYSCNNNINCTTWIRCDAQLLIMWRPVYFICRRRVDTWRTCGQLCFNFKIDTFMRNTIWTSNITARENECQQMSKRLLINWTLLAFKESFWMCLYYTQLLTIS